MLKIATISFLCLLGLFVAVWASTHSSSYEVCEQERYSSQKEAPDFTVEIAYFVVCEGVAIDANGELITALGTVAIAAFTLTLWLVTGSSVRLAGEEFIATHRPDIILREPRFEWVGEKQIVRFFLVNRGDGAGTVIDSRIGLEHHEDIGPALNMLCNGSNDLGHIALASGEIRECEWTVPGVIQLMRVAADEPTLGLLGAIYLMGSLDYVDGSGRRRRTVFCRKYDSRRRRFVPTGDPEHEYAD